MSELIFEKLSDIKNLKELDVKAIKEYQ